MSGGGGVYVKSFPRSTVFVVRYVETGNVSAVFASIDAALDDVAAVDDGRYIEPWSLRGGLVERRSQHESL